MCPSLANDHSSRQPTDHRALICREDVSAWLNADLADEAERHVIVTLGRDKQLYHITHKA